MPSLGGPELIVILVIVLIVFGAGRLPNVMRDLGTGVREFKKAQTEIESATPANPSSPAAPAAPVTPVTPVAPITTAARQVEAAPALPAESSARA